MLWFVKHPAFLGGFAGLIVLSTIGSLWVAWTRRKRRLHLAKAGYAKIVEVIVDPVKSA